MFELHIIIKVISKIVTHVRNSKDDSEHKGRKKDRLHGCDVYSGQGLSDTTDSSQLFWLLPRRVTSRPPSADRHGTGSQLTEYELVTLFPAEQVSRDSVLIVSNKLIADRG